MTKLHRPFVLTLLLGVLLASLSTGAATVEVAVLGETTEGLPSSVAVSVTPRFEPATERRVDVSLGDSRTLAGLEPGFWEITARTDELWSEPVLVHLRHDEERNITLRLHPTARVEGEILLRQPGVPAESPRLHFSADHGRDGARGDHLRQEGLPEQGQAPCSTEGRRFSCRIPAGRSAQETT